MPDEKSGGVGVDLSASTSAVKSGDRQRFTVELRPGETTIVSWKKLIKEANRVNGFVSGIVPLSSDVVEDAGIPFPQGPTPDENLKDEPPANRFNAVIEKIERLYKGNDSSDEDLNDVPDDDQYDTEDSFIDDAELDEYFQVDNCSTKHNGFFVNKGKLEAVKESPVLPAQQPKKRRRKDASLPLHDDGPLRKKQVKLDKLAPGATAPASDKISSVTQGASGAESELFGDRKHQSLLKKKSADYSTDHVLSSKPSHGTLLVGLAEPKTTAEKQKHEHQLKMPVHRVKDASGHYDPRLKIGSRSHADSPPDRRLISVDGLLQLQPVKHKKKSGSWETKETHMSDGKHTQVAVHKKDGSIVKTKTTSLEKAIKELERMVAEARPATMEVQDADVNGQAIKRRLPREIKQKLAKVARLAQANDGEVPDVVVNRLMGFLGHTMQLRTLKRNLRMMISSGLSANKEKEALFQQIKREAYELITQDFEQHATMTNNIQEVGSEGKEVNKKKYSMSVALEDKICDLYDLYVDGLDEDSGSQIRKLYDELEHMWPTGLMDGASIKRSIYRSKDRRRALRQNTEDGSHIKKKKLSTPKLVDKDKLGSTSAAQRPEPQPVEKQTTNPSHHLKTLSNNLLPVSTLALEAPRPHSIIQDKLKSEKVKTSSNNDFVDDVRAPIFKKKMKHMPEGDSVKVHIRPEKLPSNVDERPKAQKPQIPVAAQKSSSSHSSASTGQ